MQKNKQNKQKTMMMRIQKEIFCIGSPLKNHNFTSTSPL